MPKVFYTKDGDDKSRTNQGSQVGTNRLVAALENFEIQFSSDPPFFNKSSDVSEYSDYRYVVVSVQGDDVCNKFPKPGYYTICELSPKECSRLLNLHVPLA